MSCINGPIVALASNASPATIFAPQGVSEFVAFFETTSSDANATVAVTCLPNEGSVAQPVASGASLAPGAIAPLKINGLQVNAFVFTPNNLSAGHQLKTILQPISK
jgi:hypothetical protein